MNFNKTGRKQPSCGECNHFEKTEGFCQHEKMDNLKVSADLLTPCGGSYFEPLDDYEDNG